MRRLGFTVAVLLLLCVALPTIAQAAQTLVPLLIALLVFLGLVRLLLPRKRKR